MIYLIRGGGTYPGVLSGIAKLIGYYGWAEGTNLSL